MDKGIFFLRDRDIVVYIYNWLFWWVVLDDI